MDIDNWPGPAIIRVCAAADIHYTKEYPGDLRNRIVGARIIADGHSPIFTNGRKGMDCAIMTPIISIRSSLPL